MGEVTVVPITSTIRDIPSEVLLSKQDGMHNACAINCDHLQTVSKDKIGTLITTLSKEKLLEIRNAICFALNRILSKFHGKIEFQFSKIEYL